MVGMAPRGRRMPRTMVFDFGSCRSRLTSSPVSLGGGKPSVSEKNMEDLAAEEYLRQRIGPKPGDPLYLHLSDLLLAIRDKEAGRRVVASKKITAGPRTSFSCGKPGWAVWP